MACNKPSKEAKDLYNKKLKTMKRKRDLNENEKKKPWSEFPKHIWGLALFGLFFANLFPF